MKKNIGLNIKLFLYVFKTYLKNNNAYLAYMQNFYYTRGSKNKSNKDIAKLINDDIIGFRNIISDSFSWIKSYQRFTYWNSLNDKWFDFYEKYDNNIRLTKIAHIILNTPSLSIKFQKKFAIDNLTIDNVFSILKNKSNFLYVVNNLMHNG